MLPVARIFATVYEDDVSASERAGYDCGKNGPAWRNCHFSLFRTQAMTRAWERGYKRGKHDAALAGKERGEG